MAQTVTKTTTAREPGLLYYVKKGDIWASPMKKPGSKAKGKAKLIVATGVETDYSKFIYFVGTAAGKLTVERTKRANR